MNDSFLEDVGIVPESAAPKSNIHMQKRYITTRRVLSPPTKQEKVISSSGPNVPKSKTVRSSASREASKVNEIDPDGKPRCSTPITERKNLGKDSSSRHTSNRCSDSSCKENTRPSIESSSSRESGSLGESKKDIFRLTSDSKSKKSDCLDKTNPVSLLNAIKDLISRYTEQETMKIVKHTDQEVTRVLKNSEQETVKVMNHTEEETSKILKAMQDLYINSQSNLIKHLMMQTDELVREMSLHRSSGNMKSVIAENEKIREDNFMLRTQVQVLQKKLDEMSLIKEENMTLKLKLKELQQ
ncbi:hypothetical protein QAD02_023102 [Eretmocerus hayati]|uniref:Uncharacterized protein n=1 Tax=Eretmocerus hayati TaxID=131215 RepID=A0ACC2PUZ3_9HYME|nr:hypothetical protein QAD02_023102 [Eretmocerus hayati]